MKISDILKLKKKTKTIALQCCRVFIGDVKQV